jgi:ribosomal protein S12 methylthiotransferase accessory factor
MMELPSAMDTISTAGLHNLFQPVGGLLHGHSRFQAAAGEPPLFIRIERGGRIEQVCNRIPRKRHPAQGNESIEGAGVGLNDQEATIRARAEALERYCACVFSPDQFIRASANELGNAALDLAAVPRCSKAELSNPLCPLLLPDKSVPLRWVQGVSLFDGRRVYLPVIMVYLYAGIEGPGERFWFPISTGCAAHTSLERALISAVLEVIERDAISITWLQKLGLPRLEMDFVPAVVAPYWERYQSSCKEPEYVFFDATTDLGIPTVYGVQISPENKRLTTLVSCCTALQPADAVVGAMREMAAGRIAFRQPRPVPNKLEDFTEIFHGASYMARSEQAHAFNFLLHAGRKRLLSEMACTGEGNDKLDLRLLIDILKKKQLEAFALDLTTDEAIRAGLRIVRVIIPGLQPLSFNYRARYLGHPRLYEMPRMMGYPVYNEEQLNHWPQPFA